MYRDTLPLIYPIVLPVYMATAVSKYCGRLLFMQCDSSFPTLPVSFNSLIFVFIPSLQFQLLNTMIHGKWVPVTTVWRVLRLWMQEWPPIWKVAWNVLNKQLWTADKG